MRDQPLAGFADRMKTAAAARQALLGKLKPRPTVIDPEHETRGERRAAEIKAVRTARAEAREDRRRQAEEIEVAARAVQLAAEEAVTESGLGGRGHFPGPLFLAVAPIEVR